MVNENEVITIKLDDIIPNRFQPREVFDEQSMQELADSIKTHGVIQPIIVRPVGDKYEIIAGERRYKASVMAGKIDIPALVRNKDDKDSSIIAFIENSQRKNVSAIEEAKTCERLLLNNDLTQEQLAKQLGMSQSTLANKLRLLTLPIEVQEALLHGEISERHGRSLLTLKDTKAQLNLLERIKEEKLTVRELDGVIKNMIEEPNKDGLYNLPGSDEAKEAEAKATQEASNDGEMDFSRYENLAPEETVQEEPATNQFLDFLNNYEVPTEQEAPAVPTPEIPVTETPADNQNDGEFLDFLNNFESSLPEVPAEETKEEAPTEQAAAQDNEFLSFLNNFDQPGAEQPKVETPVATPAAQVEQAPAQDNEFLSFLNNFDQPAAEEPKTEPVAPVAPVEEKKEEVQDNDFLAFLSNFDGGTKEEAPVTPTAEPVVEAPATPEPPKVESSEEKKFDDFLSSFNSGITPPAEEEKPAPAAPAAPVEEVKVEAPVVDEAQDNDFLSFLNKFEGSTEAPVTPTAEPVVEAPVENPTPVVEETKAEPVAQEAPAKIPLEKGFEDFLKRYEAPVSEPVDLGPVEEMKEKETVNESQNVAETMDINAKYLNPIEEVAPKVDYVENSPNYVDVTKPISYDSVDSIIGELKVVTDKIKKSKYKITTEETNFDDIYTITIKIDKRNFL